MKPPKRIELTPEETEALLARVRAALSDGDYRIIKAIVDTYLFLNRIIEQKTTSIMRLLRMIFGSPKHRQTSGPGRRRGPLPQKEKIIPYL